MNVELTMQFMFDQYPALFKTRADCLDHLFCTIGNGYEWVNGELISITENLNNKEIENLKTNLVDNTAYQHNKLSLRDEYIYYYNENKKNNFENVPEHLRDNYINNFDTAISKIPNDQYYKEPERYKRWSFYINIPNKEYVNFCENYAFLFNYPDNIKPDWLEALNECKKLLTDDGYNLPPRNI